MENIIKKEPLDDHKSPSFQEKLISVASYFTFGLSGMILIISNLFCGDLTDKFTCIHTVQSLLFGFLTTVVALISGLFLNVLNFYCPEFILSHAFVVDICLRLPQITFILACILGISVLVELKIYLPGVKSITQNLLG